MKRKLNVLDISLIVFVIAVVAILGYKQVSDRYLKYDDQAGQALEMPQMTYTYRVEEIRQMSVDAVEIGDTLYDYASKSSLGTVVGLETEPFTKWIYGSDGKNHLAQVPNKYVLYITVEGPVQETDTRYLADGVFELKVNSKIKLATRKVGFEGKLYEFN